MIYSHLARSDIGCSRYICNILHFSDIIHIPNYAVCADASSLYGYNVSGDCNIHNTNSEYASYIIFYMFSPIHVCMYNIFIDPLSVRHVPCPDHKRRSLCRDAIERLPSGHTDTLL